MNKKYLMNFFLMIISILLVFSLIGSIYASDLSDNQLTNDDSSLEISKDMDKNILSGSDTIYMSLNGSDETGDGSVKNPYKSLNQSVEKSNNGSTIYLSEGEYAGEANQNISIDKTLTIIGKGNDTVIDGENSSSIFIMNSNAKLTLIGLTLSNAYHEGNQYENGGAIINEGGQLSLINCTIKNSYGNYNGGAIYNNYGLLNIINSSFTNNSAIQYGGCIYSLGITSIENSYFAENFITAEKGVGGAIAAGGTITINNTDFYRNRAIYSAGALLSLGNATIDNCNFINQTTNYTGGAISNHGNMFINNSYFYGGESRFYAAAILAPPSGHHVVTEVYNTIFEKNHVGNHGAVSNNFQDTELLMKNCALVDNYIIKNYYYGDISLDDNATVQYCWWGQNEISPYYYSPHSSNYNPEKINASKWLVMTFSSNGISSINNGSIDPENINLLTVDLKHYFDNETKEICEYDEDINLPLEVKIYTNKGLVKTAVLTNGSFSINYKWTSGVNKVYAQINNQTLELAVKEKEEANLIAEDLVKYYKNESQLEVKLLDNESNPIVNKTVNIQVCSKTYTKTTNESGIAKLNINLIGGNYIANISFVDHDYQNQNKSVSITVLKNSTSLVADNLLKYYRNGSQLKVKLSDKNGNALENKTIKLNINGKSYSNKTDSNGIAIFAINQKAGKYSAEIIFKEDKTHLNSSKTIKITVKSPKITAKAITIHRNSNFVAIFKDYNGNPIKNAKVKIVFSKKTYVRTTNSKGEAKLKVTVKPGTYTVKASFQSTKVYGTGSLSTKVKVVK